MAEFPDANSGGLDPGGEPKCKAPLWKRVRAWAIIGGLYVLFFGMAAAAVPLLRSVFRPGVVPEDRLLHLLYAIGLLAPLGFVVRYFVRMRLKTGRWMGTKEQRLEDQQKRRGQWSTVGGKRVCAANANSPMAYAIHWASYAAFQPTFRPWQRACAWLVLAAYTLSVVAVALFGLISFGAAFDDSNTHTAILLFIALGLAALVWPAVVARRLIRGIRSGKVGTTLEELDALRAQRAAWAAREQRKPLKSKLINSGIGVLIYGLWWIRVTVHHAQHPRESWITPAMFTPALIYSIWVQFRRPRNTQ